nr:hypothetical protein [Chloroflexaceae bacterium]
PTVVGQRVIWVLPNLASFAGRNDRIFIRLPEAPLGTEYSAKLTITTSDASMEMESKLAIVNQLYLPLVAGR